MNVVFISCFRGNHLSIKYVCNYACGYVLLKHLMKTRVLSTRPIDLARFCTLQLSTYLVNHIMLYTHENHLQLLWCFNEVGMGFSHLMLARGNNPRVPACILQNTNSPVGLGH